MYRRRNSDIGSMLVVFFYGYTALGIVLNTLPWSLIPIAIFLVLKNKPRKKSSKRTPSKKRKTNAKQSGPKRSHGENKMYEIQTICSVRKGF